MVTSQLALLFQLGFKPVKGFFVSGYFQWVCVLEHSEILRWLDIVAVEKLFDSFGSSLRVMRRRPCFEEALDTVPFVETRCR